MSADSYPFSRKPVAVSPVATQYRRIHTALPAPESIPILDTLERYEPRSMALDQLPVVWDHAEGYQIYDAYGNCWIDFTSGIFVTNVGHAHPAVQQAIVAMVEKPLLHNYYFPSVVRAEFVAKLVQLTPKYLDTAFLLTTGAESTECAIKLARMHGQKISPRKLGIVSLTFAFHGKTLGAQTAGGRPAAKQWIGPLDPNFHQIPVPFCARCPWGRAKYETCGAECFQAGLKQLEANGVDLGTIAGFMVEPFQGWSAAFMPDDFVHAMREWATAHQALLIFDEVQSGFGRTGRLLAYEHYGVEADLVCCGKGISSGLPLSAVLGRRELVDVDSSLNSTHGGNPVCCAAALANLNVLVEEKLVEHAATLGPVLEPYLLAIAARHPDYIPIVQGRGLVWALHIVNPQTGELAVGLGDLITEHAMRKGVLLVRTGVGTIKLGPPLCIPIEAAIEGVQALSEAIDEVLGEARRS